MTATPDHEATFRTILDAFARGDINGVLEFYDDNATVVQYLDPIEEHSGKAAIAALLQGSLESMSDLALEVTNVLVDGDHLAAEATVRGTPAGETDQVEVRYGAFMVFSDGKIQTERMYLSQA